MDIATAPQVEDCLAYLAATRYHRLVLDTAQLNFCDAAGIRVMVRARMRTDHRRPSNDRDVWIGLTEGRTFPKDR